MYGKIVAYKPFTPRVDFGDLRYIVFIVQTFGVTYEARDSVFHHPDETLRREFKIRRPAEYFDELRAARCVSSDDETVSNA